MTAAGGTEAGRAAPGIGLETRAGRAAPGPGPTTGGRGLLGAKLIDRGFVARHWRNLAPVAVLVALCVVISLFNANFLTVGNLVRLLNTAAIPAILCMGATFVILMGSIDLSVEGVVAVTAVMVSLLVVNDVSPYAIGYAALPLAILAGGVLGFLNGVLHVKLRTPSFMTTLGVGFACIGIATAILGG